MKASMPIANDIFFIVNGFFLLKTKWLGIIAADGRPITFLKYMPVTLNHCEGRKKFIQRMRGMDQ